MHAQPVVEIIISAVLLFFREKSTHASTAAAQGILHCRPAGVRVDEQSVHRSRLTVAIDCMRPDSVSGVPAGVFPCRSLCDESQICHITLTAANPGIDLRS